MIVKSIRLKRNMNCFLLFGFGSAYLAYYFLYVAKKPRLACGPKLQQFLQSHCPMLKHRYWATIWCFESRVQTLIRLVIKSYPKVKYNKEFLTLPDGGHVAVDWVENDEKSDKTRERRPTVLILPGLTGSSEDNYVLHLVDQTSKLGYRSVVFNYRGIGGAHLKTPRTYCATNTEDMAEVVRHIKNKYPEAPLVAVGTSMGGLILTHYMINTGKCCPLLAGMTFSVPWNVFESTKTLKLFINDMIFNRHLTGNLINHVKKNEHFFKDRIDLEPVYQSQTIREFDEFFTSFQFGYRDYKEYYAAACIDDKFHKVPVPLLCLNAADDPFSPGYSIPMDKLEESEKVAVVLTSRGGHIGFLEGLLPIRQNYMDRLFAQYVDAVFRNPGVVREISSQ